MPKPQKVSPKLLIIFGFLVVIALAEITAIVWRLDQVGPADSPSPKTFNNKLYSIDQASSLWAVVNKRRILPSNYTPPDLTVPNVPLRTNAVDTQMSLRRQAAADIERLFNAAAKSSIKLRLASGFRSYSLQQIVYDSQVRSLGRAAADKESARAGHSEHQTGLAADIEPFDRRCEFAVCFGETTEGKWLAKNSYKYGFVIRYSKNKESLTGYTYEPWHFRYVGAELSKQLYAGGQTLEEFFNLPPAPDYVSRPLALRP